MNNHHGTLVDIAGSGVLLRGPSGSGKSDLALRLIDRGAVLVADDQVILEPRQKDLWARAPDALYGLIEVRGIGIMSRPAIRASCVKLVVDLVPGHKVQRVPEPRGIIFEGLTLPAIELPAFDLSTPIKIELAIRYPDQIGFGVDDHKKAGYGTS